MSLTSSAKPRNGSQRKAPKSAWVHELIPQFPKEQAWNMLVSLLPRSPGRGIESPPWPVHLPYDEQAVRGKHCLTKPKAVQNQRLPSAGPF